MADEPIGADEVARQQFSTAFRGFDQNEVRAFLGRVGAALASLHERERALRERLAAAEERPPAREVGEDDLEQALGAEMAKVLHAAREAAAEIRSHAEESVARMLREATDEAASVRAEAEALLARRSEEAETEAASILAAAQQRVAALLEEAETTSASAIEEATTRGREMVAEAQAVRERVLKDLSRKRKAAAVQLEQLLAARERLLGAYDMVRRNLDDVTRELAVVEDEARLAAEVAGFRPPPGDDTGEVEVVAAEVPVAAEREPEPAPVPEPPPTPAGASAVEPEPQPEEAPETPAPEPPSDDRRSSSLRLLRRQPDPVELQPFDDEVEGVRILRPDATPSPRPVALVPEPAPEASPAPPPAAAPEPVAVVEPEPQPEPEPVAETAPAPVEDLFARLRADRAAAVVHAEAVLAEVEPVAEAPHDEPEPAPEPEPEGPAADAVFEARDAAVEATERALTRALKRALADEQNEVLDTLRRAKKTPKLDELLPAASEHVDRYAGVAGAHLAVGAEAGASSQGGAPPAVDALAAGFGGDVVEDLRARIGRALDASGGDEEALVEAISATYREWKTSRSEPFARHHVAAAYAFGVFDAAPAGPLAWVVDAAEGNCPDCDDNALAGPTAKGEAYPTGQPHPPAHTGCRCLVLPAAH